MYDELDKELIDAINRVPHEVSPAADRGSCLNEILDRMLGGIPLDQWRKDSEIVSEANTFVAVLNGNAYTFPADFVVGLGNQLRWSLCQRYMECALEMGAATVHLYGYCDYWQGDKIIDLKTTSQRGDFGKYANYWQRYVYPFIATVNGNEVNSMEFLIVELGKVGSATEPTISRECYDYNHSDATYKIYSILGRFTNWLRVNEDRITDTKIIQEF